MSLSLVKILSYSIFIAEQQNNNILVILLKDYARTRITKTQFLFMLMLIISYREKTIDIDDDKIYKIMSLYIRSQSTQICRSLILS
jgi:hypothetical protein